MTIGYDRPMSVLPGQRGTSGKGMVANNSGPSVRPDDGQLSWRDEEVTEISLLMPAGQAAELLYLAGSRRLTVGQLLRGLVRAYLTQAGPEHLEATLGDARPIVN